VWYDGGAMEGHVPPLDVVIPLLAEFLKQHGLLGQK